MLELDNVCYLLSKKGEELPLLNNISLEIPQKHFMAIVGPSGCGKTTLLRVIAGLLPESSGALRWDSRNLTYEQDFEPWEIGYVPQFSIAYDKLTVLENIEATTRLRTLHDNSIHGRIELILQETGLHNLQDRSVSVLSGGQKRRLALAMELVTSPKILLCDEVTSGLDPRSEEEILALLHQLSQHQNRIIISVTHSLARLENYDSILVLHQGHVAYHGPPNNLNHYFSTNHAEEIYPKLLTREPEQWLESWNKHNQAYYESLRANEPPNQTIEQANEDPAHRPPNFFNQFQTLLARRWKIFFRDRGQLILQIAIILCFPILVTLFAEKGREPIKKLSQTREKNFFIELHNQSNVHQNHIKVGSAVSGIIMFQTVLLALMGSNNAAREIASERTIYEKEKFAGLNPLSYLLSKITFLGTIVLIQSLWMGIFVELFWTFPGNFTSHLIFLILINTAMTSVCLAISSLMHTAEQASLLSIYLIGFQLPLSGAILALPEHIELFTRPFIAAYWAWSGSIESLGDGVYNATKTIIGTTLSSPNSSHFALLCHLITGLALTWLGIQKTQHPNSQ